MPLFLLSTYDFQPHFIIYLFILFTVSLHPKKYMCPDCLPNYPWYMHSVYLAHGGCSINMCPKEMLQGHICQTVPCVGMAVLHLYCYPRTEAPCREVTVDWFTWWQCGVGKPPFALRTLSTSIRIESGIGEDARLQIQSKELQTQMWACK